MANQTHLNYLKQGVKKWNQWRNDNPGEQPDLEGVNLEGATLERIHFEKAKLSRANLKWTNLRGAHLTKAELTETDLRMADFSESFIRGANLTKADLRGAVLVNADLREACLANANLSGANITGATFYKSFCDGWIIDGIVCTYIFLDAERLKRAPAGRNFRSQEFEKCFKRSELTSMLSSKVLQQILHVFSFHPSQRNRLPPSTENL